MKRTIVTIKGNNKDEIWCNINGTALEIIGSYLALTENILETFMKEEEHGKKALGMLLEDVTKAFEKAIGKANKESDKNV